MTIPVTYLGQSGLIFEFEDTVVCTDPYLTDSVADKYGESLKRLLPVPENKELFQRVQSVLISHNHEDHCDPESVQILLNHNSEIRFYAPKNCHELLLSAGVLKEHISTPPTEWLTLTDQIQIRRTPAAHPTLDKDENGEYSSVGYVIQTKEKTIYFAGDTSAHSTIIQELRELNAIDTAFLPVNEKNYFRDEAGIIGNMSIREAFEFASRIRAKELIPIHWDLFEPNQAYEKEILLLKELIAPTFSVRIKPSHI